MIKYIEYIETDGSEILYTLTNAIVSSIDDVLYFDFMPLNGTVHYDGWYTFLTGNVGMCTTMGGYSPNGPYGISFCNGGFSTWPSPFTVGNKYECVFNKNGIIINGVMNNFTTTATGVGTISPLLMNGTTKNDAPFRCPVGKYYGLKIMSNGTVVCDYRPVLDDNDTPCFYDEISHTKVYHVGAGTPTAGPVLHIFYTSKTSLRFDATGGTDTFDVEAETTWTASTPSFVSLSPSTGDTGTTTVTVICPSYTGETRREDVITFTDNDDYTLTFKARQNGNSAGFSNIYLGDNNLLSNTIYLGDNAVNTIYLGEEIIYSNGPFVGLKVKPLELLFNNASLTNEITIQSSEDWAITDDSGGWLSYSTTTGTTGKTVVTVTASTTQADRTATITITTANYSATVSVSQQLIQFLDYIYVDQARDRYCFIDTGIYPTTDTVATIKYKDMGIDDVCLYGFSVAGYYGNDTPQCAPNDDSDYRFVSGKNYVGTIFDLNSSRFTYSNLSVDADGYANVTIGNNYVYDNVAQASRGTGTTQSSIVTTTIPMYINISNIIRFNSAQIMQGNNLVFDGHAAYYNGVYGVYDNVSGQMLLPYIPTYPVVGGNY